MAQHCWAIFVTIVNRMCGIFGYISKNKLDATSTIVEGLKRLEYRGYDSSGLAAIVNSRIYSKKKSGRISELEKVLPPNIQAHVAIGHTRWATHGKPVDKNAHPHRDCTARISLVHNGIIENFKDLRSKLEKKGHIFKSETDTEVAVHLIEDFLKNTSLEEAVRLTLKSIIGTYAFVIIEAANPNKIIVARNSSPLLIGFTDQTKFVASDASAILPYTKKVAYLRDGEFAVLTPTDFRIATLERKSVSRRQETIGWSEDEIQKGDFPHFMLKEIFEEPESVENAIRGRLIPKEGASKLGGLELVEAKLKKIKNLKITGCGTAYYAGLFGEYAIEEFGRIAAKAEIASELRYKKSLTNPNSALLAVSQSGETADTLGLIKDVKKKRILTLGVVNVVGSSIAKETQAGVYNHVGPEIGVASTKAFAGQMAVMVLLALFFGKQRGLPLSKSREIAFELSRIPSKMRRVLAQNKNIKNLAKKYSKYDHFLFLGRKFNYPIAMEGALKLKEISYIHAEGYGAGEMKHGPIAMIDKNFPTLAIVPQDSVYEKMLSNLQEIRARDGRIIAIATAGDKNIEKFADDVIFVPKTIELLNPFLTVLPLHMFAYHCGVIKGHDVDKPRNLAKSVTVE